MTVFDEDPTETPDRRPVTPLQVVNEGFAVPLGGNLIYRFDDEDAPRKAQRLISCTNHPGYSHVQPVGINTSLGSAGGDVGRKEFYQSLIKLRRIHDILGVNYINPSVYAFAASGQTITYGINDGQSLGGGPAIIPGQDLAFCDSTNRSDITAISSVSIGDSTATLTTVLPLSPASWGNNIYIMRPEVGSFPVFREDRTHYTERSVTGWLDISLFDTPYVFANRVMAYPIQWTFDEYDNPLLTGTFRVEGANALSGSNAVELTTIILGAIPETGYAYPNFPGPDSPLKLLNNDTATLDLSEVEGIPEGTTHIKIHFCQQVADESNPPAWAISPTQTTCKHNLKVRSNSALAGYVGSGDILDIYKNGFHCSKYLFLNKAEWEAYEGPCNNSACREYETWESGYYPTPQEINNFWMGAGEFYTQDVVGLPNVTFDRDNYDGILHLLGIYKYNYGGLFIQRQEWTKLGVFLHDTGEVDEVTGYNIYRTWDESVLEGGTYPRDTDTGLFATFEQYISKKDPAGGKLGSPELDERLSHAAGYNFENLIGCRRLGTMPTTLGSSVGGAGFVEVQRVRAVRHTSRTFAKMEGTGIVTDSLTELEFYGSTQYIDAFEYDAVFRYPKWRERVADGASIIDKGLSNTIFTSAIGGNIMVLWMDLMPCHQAVYNGAITPPLDLVYYTGGLFCLGEIVQQDTGPYSAFPIGSRQERCTVGDVISITHEDTVYKAIVIGTKILAESSDVDPAPIFPPNGGAPGMTQTIMDYHDRLDMVICALDGLTGQEMEDFHDAEGPFLGLTVTSVRMEAVSPPRIYTDGSEDVTNYDPEISVTDKDNDYAITELVDGLDYMYDPLLGEIYFKRENLPSSDNLVIHIDGHVFDTHPTLYAEDLCQCDTGLTGLLEGFISAGPGDDGLINCSLQLDNGIDPVASAIIIVPFNSMEPPEGFSDWDFPDDANVWMFEKEGYPGTQWGPGDLGWVSDPSSTSYIIGTNAIYPYSHTDFSVVYTVKFPIHIIPVLRNIHADEVKKCVLDLSLTNGFHFKEWHEYDKEGEIDEHDSAIIDDDVEIKILSVWYTIDGATITLEMAEDSLSISNTLKKVTVWGIDYLRGTVDITQCMKAAISAPVAGAQLALIPFPAESAPDTWEFDGTSLTEFVYSAMSKFSASDYGEDDLPSRISVFVDSLHFDAMDLGALHFQIDKDALKTIDYTDDLLTPNLTHEKPAP